MPLDYDISTILINYAGGNFNHLELTEAQKLALKIISSLFGCNLKHTRLRLLSKIKNNEFHTQYSCDHRDSKMKKKKTMITSHSCYIKILSCEIINIYELALL